MFLLSASSNTRRTYSNRRPSPSHTPRPIPNGLYIAWFLLDQVGQSKELKPSWKKCRGECTKWRDNECAPGEHLEGNRARTESEPNNHVPRDCACDGDYVLAGSRYRGGLRIPNNIGWHFAVIGKHGCRIMLLKHELWKNWSDIASLLQILPV